MFWADQFDPIMHARTDEGQRARFPGDTGLSSVARMQKQSVEFPGAGTHYFHSIIPLLMNTSLVKPLIAALF